MGLFLLKFMINAMALDFDIVFPFLDCVIPRRASYGVYISQLIRFAKACNNVADFIMYINLMSLSTAKKKISKI